MIAAGDALLASCAALCTAAHALDAVTLRVRDDTARMLERDRSSCPPPVRAVLIIHDSPAVLAALEHAIAALGVPVLRAETVAEARVAMRSRPAVVLADYHLGSETSAALLRDRPACSRATILSARVDTDSLATIARGVGARVLQTPTTLTSMDDLVAIVRADLDA